MRKFHENVKNLLFSAGGFVLASGSNVRVDIRHCNTTQLGNGHSASYFQAFSCKRHSAIFPTHDHERQTRMFSLLFPVDDIVKRIIEIEWRDESNRPSTVWTNRGYNQKIQYCLKYIYPFRSIPGGL